MVSLYSFLNSHGIYSLPKANHWPIYKYEMSVTITRHLSALVLPIVQFVECTDVATSAHSKCVAKTVHTEGQSHNGCTFSLP